MKLPKPRFTVRRMMAAVVVAAIVLATVSWMKRWAAHFLSLSHQHTLIAEQTVEWRPGNCMAVSTPRSLYHLELAAKYQHAARYPWLPVEADPTEPK